MTNKMSGLQLGNYSMGDRSLQGGEIERLTSMGDLHAVDTHIHNLHVLGEATIENCKLNVVSVKGEMHATKGRIDMANIIGQVELVNVECGSIHLLGQLISTASSCRILRHGNPLMNTMLSLKRKLKLEGEIRGETLENFYPLTLNHKQQFKNIINCAKLHAKDEIECIKFFNFATLSVKEINADMVYIYPCKNVQVKEIHGSLVIVDPAFDESWFQGIAMDVSKKEIMKKTSLHNVHIDCIEADEVILDYITCDVVRARNVVIGPHAKITRVEYEGNCEIHPEANIKEKVLV